MIGLVLSVALMLQVPTVTVVHPDRNVTMTVTDAERLRVEALAKGNTALAAALTAALGTRPSKPVDTRCLKPHEREHARWQRQASQSGPCE